MSSGGVTTVRFEFVTGAEDVALGPGTTLIEIGVTEVGGTGGSGTGGSGTGGSASGGTGGTSDPTGDVEHLCVESGAAAYSTVGNTCNLNNPGVIDLPRLAIDELNYNEFFTGSGYDDPFDPNVGDHAGSGDWVNGFSRASKGCGACLRVTGPNGSIVGMVWEIADIAAVGELGAPNHVLIESDSILDVRPSQGPGVDVVLQPVPCPILGGIRLRAQIFNDLAVFYTPYNSVYPIERFEFRAENHDQWYELHSDWTNRFRYENYSPQVIPHDPANLPVRFRLTSIYGDVVESDWIDLTSVAVGQSAVTESYELGVNFTPRPIPAGECSINRTCGNRQFDPGEECEIHTSSPVSCASLGAGTGVAECDPLTCTWATDDCQ